MTQLHKYALSILVSRYLDAGITLWAIKYRGFHELNPFAAILIPHPILLFIAQTFFTVWAYVLMSWTQKKVQNIRPFKWVVALSWFPVFWNLAWLLAGK